MVLLFQRNATVEGSTLPLAMLTLPGIIGLWVAVTGYQGAAGWLAAEREDGTLLRAKAVPQGMVGYLVARIVAALVDHAVHAGQHLRRRLPAPARPGQLAPAPAGRP